MVNACMNVRVMYVQVLEHARLSPSPFPLGLAVPPPQRCFPSSYLHELYLHSRWPFSGPAWKYLYLSRQEERPSDPFPPFHPLPLLPSLPPHLLVSPLFYSAGSSRSLHRGWCLCERRSVCIASDWLHTAAGASKHPPAAVSSSSHCQ